MQGCGRQRRPPIRFPKFHKSPMQVTQEDGGKLNAFAKEPRMVVMEPGEAPRSNRLLLIGGGVLVLVLMAVASRLS
jgi:hypothetical protein